MQSRLYVNGREVHNPVLRGMAATIVLGIVGLIVLLLSILLFSIIGAGIAIGAGLAGIGIGSMAVRNAILRRHSASLNQERNHAQLHAREDQ